MSSDPPVGSAGSPGELERTDASSSPREEDLALVRRVLARDPEALEALVERLARIPAMIRARNLRLGAPLDAEEVADAAQETMAAVWSKLAHFEGRAAFDTWVFRFAQNEFFKATKRKRRREQRFVLEFEPVWREESTAVFDIDPALLHQSVERLDAQAADIVRQRHFERLTFPEIAARRGEPVGTVKTRYYRAIDRLRVSLASHWRKARG